jgi:hypothetical protein
MTEKVVLEGLPDRVAEYGPAAYLVTIGEDGPHVVSVVVTLEDGTLTMGAGRTSRRNVADRPVATLLWPAGPDGTYSLLVDGDRGRPSSTGWRARRPTPGRPACR